VMQYQTYRPGPPLADYVEYLWALRDAPAHSAERIVPSGTLELVVNLHEDALWIYDPATGGSRQCSGAAVSGAYRRFFVIDARAHASIVGVHFRPGRAQTFLGVPPGELADRHVDLEMLGGSLCSKMRCACALLNADPAILRCPSPLSSWPSHACRSARWR
jgi:hypothetical protein